MSTTTTNSKVPTGRVATASVLCAAALVGATVAIMMAFGPHHAAHAAVPQRPASLPATNTTPTPPPNIVPVAPVNPPAVTPSAAVASLQRQLAQLNYYEGPIDGTMNTQTQQAIEYLQRDAGLPQTGQLDSATQTALSAMLVHGNNQMAG
ncbi:peptidoglycan-binding domain-containing protein [Jatrophihabitans sp. DSM 45814]